jgi:uncharacterized protein YjbI with pentapeptide repeats
VKRPANKEIRLPELPKHLPAEALDALADRAEHTARLFARCDLSGQSAADVVFEQVMFRRASLARTTLITPRLADVRAEVTDFSGAEWKKARFRRVEFIECRLLGVQWLEAELEDAVFKGCNLESAVFASAIFKVARFDACVLRGAMFDGADLSDVVFHRCDLTNADLTGATLRDADLRGSIIDGLRVGPKELQGATIDPAQAIQVAGLLGLTVRSLDEA